MNDKKDEAGSNTNRIETNAGDNATNVVSGIANKLTTNQYFYINFPNGMNKQISVDDLSIEEKELLKAGYMDAIRILPQHFNPIALISAGGQAIPQDARYKRAMKRLREIGLIRRIEFNTETYELTGIGDTIAESLI